MTAATPSYFTALSPDLYVPTQHDGGAWDPNELHVSPVGGLMVHHQQQWLAQRGESGKAISRISIDILGALPRGDIELTTTMLRPGRTISLLETTATINGRPTVTARSWLLMNEDTEALEAVEQPRIPGPDETPAWDMTETWPGGYISSLEVRRNTDARPGRAHAWLRSSCTLIDGVAVSPLASYVALIDTANGVAVRAHPRELMFPNVDLALYFFRQPRGPWVGLDTSVTFGPTGQGLTHSVLHDERGPVGTVSQILTVRPNAH